MNTYSEKRRPSKNFSGLFWEAIDWKSGSFCMKLINEFGKRMINVPLLRNVVAINQILLNIK